jgi:hypothetical protein|nr:MAG TPA_asm: hypothetical protein [Caudoviricetes sp.]
MTIGEIIEHFDMFNDKIGFQILPSTRAKYKKGDEMYFARAKYKDCEIAYLSAKNDCVVFVVTHTEAVKNGLIKED